MISRIAFLREVGKIFAPGDISSSSSQAAPHSIGFRFVADATAEDYGSVPAASVAGATGPSELSTSTAAPKPSIAILPFRQMGGVDPYATIADALPHELIAELSRLRWLFVIASGSSFRMCNLNQDIRRIGDLLKVCYCLTGVIDIAGDALGVSVELADTRDGGVIWAEHFTGKAGAVVDIRVRIISAVVAALEIRIPLNEARIARLKETDDLDAWSAYHLGLQHMFRFNRADNARATALFRRALAADRGFARAYAGLSFTPFQNPFLRNK